MDRAGKKNEERFCSFNPKLRIYLEGNIGAGKSTLLNYLSTIPEVEIHSEPLQSWQNLDGINLLDLYYKDINKYAFPFQSYVLLTLAQRNNKFSDKIAHVYERSLMSAKNCFIESLSSLKKIDPVMKTIFDKWFDFLDASEKPDLIIYLKTSPEKLIQRINDRGRFEERQIDSNYLLLLHSLHEKWLTNSDTPPVLTINGDLPLDEMEDKFHKCKKIIEKLIMAKRVAQMEKKIMETNLFRDKDEK